MPREIPGTYRGWVGRMHTGPCGTVATASVPIPVQRSSHQPQGFGQSWVFVEVLV